MSETLFIARLGGQGDGVAETSGGPVFVPFALPGEAITAKVKGGRGSLVSVEKPAPEGSSPAVRDLRKFGRW